MMKQKKLKNTALSSEDISNLAIFKSVIAEAGSLRNHVTKLKVNQLKFSAVATAGKSAKVSQAPRREIITSLIDSKIGVTFKEPVPRVEPASKRLL